MALIELNLEKPALKRTELVKESEVETTEESETETEVSESEIEETEIEETGVEETKGRGKARTFVRRAAILSGTAAGLAAARKLQQKRASKGDEVEEFEEDWQTAE